jgi:hypothetical protein
MMASSSLNSRIDVFSRIPRCSQTEKLQDKADEAERLKEKVIYLEMAITNETEEKAQYEVNHPTPANDIYSLIMNCD